MNVSDVVNEYGSEILGLGLGRRALAVWLNDNLPGSYTTHFARKVLAELEPITEAPAPREPAEMDSLEAQLRSAYGIHDPSWYPVRAWGGPGQMQAKWERKLDVLDAERTRSILENLPHADLPQVDRDGGDRMAVLSIRDTHFGMFTDHPGAYDSYDLGEAQHHYQAAASHLMVEALREDSDWLVFPVGSDLLHVDGPQNSTTRGTPQEVSTAWWKAYEAALVSINAAILNAAKLFKRVTVVLEHGNHDHNSARTLGAHLKAHWGGTVEVMAGDEPIKTVALGGTRVFFHHGEMKPEAYRGVLMTDYRQQMLGATYVEVLTGHLHHRRRGVLKDSGDYLEDSGIVHRVTPALTPSSNWAQWGGYRSEPGGQMTCYTPNGFHALKEYRPEMSPR